MVQYTSVQIACWQRIHRTHRMQDVEWRTQNPQHDKHVHWMQSTPVACAVQIILDQVKVYTCTLLHIQINLRFQWARWSTHNIHCTLHMHAYKNSNTDQRRTTSPRPAVYVLYMYTSQLTLLNFVTEQEHIVPSPHAAVGTIQSTNLQGTGRRCLCVKWWIYCNNNNWLSTLYTSVRFPNKSKIGLRHTYMYTHVHVRVQRSYLMNGAISWERFKHRQKPCADATQYIVFLSPRAQLRF